MSYHSAHTYVFNELQFVLHFIFIFILLLHSYFCCLACNEYCISVRRFWDFLICHSLVTYQRALLGVCLSESLWYVCPLSWKCQKNTWRDMNCRLRISRLPISSSCGHWHANIYAAEEIQGVSSGCPTSPRALIDVLLASVPISRYALFASLANSAQEWCISI